MTTSAYSHGVKISESEWDDASPSTTLGGAQIKLVEGALFPRSPSWSSAMHFADTRDWMPLSEDVVIVISRNSRTTFNTTALCQKIARFLEESCTRSTPQEISSEQLGALQRMYDWEQPDDIVRFLQDEPFLLGILHEAYEHIQEHFDQTKPRLKIAVSPDEPGRRALEVLIPTTMKPTDALARVHAFDEAWWLDAPSRARNLITIDVDFL